MGRLRIASIIGLATGVIGVMLSIVPPVSALEDSLGLRAFFKLRGALPAPTGVVVVSIDEQTATRLGLPTAVRDWPRARHAHLIDRLVDDGASVIAFDLRFFQNQPTTDDEQLAAAIRRSKRVVLVQNLERLSGAWRQQDPIPELVEASAAVAPVPIPDTALVSWFWTFFRDSGGADVPTFPTVALHVGKPRALTALSTAMASAGVVKASDVTTRNGLLAFMRDARRTLKGNTSALSPVYAQLSSQSLDDVTRQGAQVMADSYAADSAAYLNFYGPPGSICTVPYEIVFEGTASRCPLTDAAVFVGAGRSRLQGAEQIDTHHTVYERSDGVDFSGVELHATAYANLLHGTALRPLNPAAAFAGLVGTGVLFGASGYWVRTRRRRQRASVRARLEAVAVVAALAAVYGVVAYALFARAYVTAPIVTPIAIQLPIALLLALLVRPVVHEERAHAVCLVADAGGSTAVGQRLPHDAYAQLMMDYNETLARCVRSRGGLALAPQGDGFVSLWILERRLESEDRARSREACLAALKMRTAAEGFNEKRPHEERLPLRIGLTLGAVTIHSDADRGAFEAIGDAVNVAARLQDLNRELRTHVLASDTVVAGLDGHLEMKRITRDIALKGVAAPPRVFEVIGDVTEMPSG